MKKIVVLIFKKYSPDENLCDREISTIIVLLYLESQSGFIANLSDIQKRVKYHINTLKEIIKKLNHKKIVNIFRKQYKNRSGLSITLNSSNTSIKICRIWIKQMIPCLQRFKRETKSINSQFQSSLLSSNYSKSL